jgi:hypothetical protein
MIRSERQWDMPTLFHYHLIEPIRSRYDDGPDFKPALEVHGQAGARTCRVAVFTDARGVPSHVRLIIPSVPDEQIPEELLPLIQTLKEHALTVLRLCYKKTISFFPAALWTFAQPGTPHVLGVELQVTADPPLDQAVAETLFKGGFQWRIELRLLADGQDPRTPLQYRYLSYYRLLEMEFNQPRKGWNSKALNEFLAPYADRICAGSNRKSARAVITDVRDRCAHLTVGRRSAGITHLDQKQAAEVERLLPILDEIGFALVNQRANGRFSFGRVAEEALPVPNDSQATVNPGDARGSEDLSKAPARPRTDPEKAHT